MSQMPHYPWPESQIAFWSGWLSAIETETNVGLICSLVSIGNYKGTLAVSNASFRAHRASQNRISPQPSTEWAALQVERLLQMANRRVTPARREFDLHVRSMDWSHQQWLSIAIRINTDQGRGPWEMAWSSLRDPDLQSYTRDFGRCSFGVQAPHMSAA